ncbi:hypothetical protein GGE66_003210 [Rhizobium leguminosarum]|uniref:Uncharacterized protein n=1 Tax=Rhizobium leguminosarum TaxID=384 RepID=A0A7W9ZSX7_RHILE|nr:hypothetical protein [Rhizobium leguminosarum]
MTHATQHSGSILRHALDPIAHDVERFRQTADLGCAIRFEGFFQTAFRARAFCRGGKTPQRFGDQPAAEIGKQHQWNDDFQKSACRCRSKPQIAGKNRQLKDQGTLIVNSDGQDVGVRLTHDEAVKCHENIVGEHCVETRDKLARRDDLLFAGRRLIQFLDLDAERRCFVENDNLVLCRPCLGKLLRDHRCSGGKQTVLKAAIMTAVDKRLRRGRHHGNEHDKEGRQCQDLALDRSPLKISQERCSTLDAKR